MEVVQKARPEDVLDNTEPVLPAEWCIDRRLEIITTKDYNSIVNNILLHFDEDDKFNEKLSELMNET